MPNKPLSYILIAGCSFCGRGNCVAHRKYTDRCEECGKRYAKYQSYKSLQRSAPTAKRAALLDELVIEYRLLKRQGYKVPKDIV